MEIIVEKIQKDKKKKRNKHRSIYSQKGYLICVWMVKENNHAEYVAIK